MVEFALIAPVLLLLILGGLEVANFALANLRVNQMAISVADNSGRVRTSIDESDIYEVFAGAGLFAQKLDFEENGRIVLSSVTDNGEKGSKAGQMIAWQRCWGKLDVDPAYGVEGDGENDDRFKDGVGANNRKIKSNRDATMMFAEVTYEYQPLIGTGWIAEERIRAEAAFNVRALRNENITNTNNLAVNDCD